MPSDNTTDNKDLLNYRVLSEAAKNNQNLTADQQQQLAVLSTKLNLPNPLATQTQPGAPLESEFLQTAKAHFVEENEKSRRTGIVKTVLNIVEVIGGAIILAIIINQFIFQPYQVVGISMLPTLETGDRLIVSKVPSTIAKITGRKYIPHRYDIVVLKDSLSQQLRSQQGDLQLVKRVIGLPGDKVVISGGHITIYNKEEPNGFNPDENLVTKDIITTPDKTWDIQPNQIFVCGDNRPNSLDSRSEQVGPIPVDHIVGHVNLRILPLNKAKIL